LSSLLLCFCHSAVLLTSPMLTRSLKKGRRKVTGYWMVSPYTFNVRNHVLNERFNAVTLSLGSLTQADTSELKYHYSSFSLCCCLRVRCWHGHWRKVTGYWNVSSYTFNVRNHVLNERINAVTLSLGSLTSWYFKIEVSFVFFSLCSCLRVWCIITAYWMVSLYTLNVRIDVFNEGFNAVTFSLDSLAQAGISEFK
jgi:hypothetical protein